MPGATSRDGSGLIQGLEPRTTGLADREDLLRTVVENAGEMLWMTDSDRAHAFYVSPQSQHLLGIDPEILAEQPRRLLDVVHPEHRDQVEHLLLGSGRQPRTLEFRVIRCDGVVRWIRERTFPVIGEDGQVLRIVGILSDTTEARRAQEALRKSQERYRAVSQLCSDFAFCYARQGQHNVCLEWMTGAFERSTGYRPHQVQKLSGWRPIIYPDDHPAFEAFMLRVEGGQTDGLELRIVSQQGQVRWLRVLVRPVPDPRTGKPARWLGAAQDVTAYHNAQEQLRASESRYRIMGETVPYGVWLAASDGKLSYASQSFLDLLGVSLDKLQLRSLPELLPPPQDQQVGEAWQNCLATGRDWDCELSFESAGQKRVVLSRGRPVRDHLGRVTCWVGVNLDITDRKRAEKALEELNATLEQRVVERTAEANRRTEQLQALAVELLQAEQRVRSRLAQTLHDDLQQLLVGAKFSLAKLRGRSCPDELALIDQVESMLNQSIDGTRSLTFELSPPILQDRGLAASLHWLGRWMQQKHGLEVEVAAEAQADPQDHQLVMLLFHCCKELLFNVVKHAQVRWAQVQLTLDGQGRCCAVVTDHGCGFDMARLQTQDVPARFGLMSIFERMAMVGGDCRITTAPGNGCSIRLTAPRHLGPAQQTAAEGQASVSSYAAAPMRPSPDGQRKVRVLLADDHQILRQGLAELLCCEEDIEVVGGAADGAQAVEMAMQLNPDVVVMDISMPRKTGIEATRELSRLAPHVRVIGLSIHPKADMAGAMLQAGAANYLNKDGPIEDLVAAIRSCALQPASGAVRS